MRSESRSLPLKASRCIIAGMSHEASITLPAAFCAMLLLRQTQFGPRQGLYCTMGASENLGFVRLCACLYEAAADVSRSSRHGTLLWRLF